jgi:hypothetical protein
MYGLGTLSSTRPLQRFVRPPGTTQERSGLQYLGLLTVLLAQCGLGGMLKCDNKIQLVFREALAMLHPNSF